MFDKMKEDKKSRLMQAAESFIERTSHVS
jgi:hypothetical protein